MRGQLRSHQIPEQSTEGCKANDHPFFCVGEYTVWWFFVDKAGERLCLVMVFLCQDLDLRAEAIASWLQGLGIINVSDHGSKWDVSAYTMTGVIAASLNVL